VTQVDPTDELLRLMNEMQEVLGPELVEHLDVVDGIGTVLRHPLVYQVPLHNPGLANRVLEAKKREIKRAVDEQEWSRFIWLHERPHRLRAFTNIMDQLTDKQYWAILGSIWTDSENIWQLAPRWRVLLESDRVYKSWFMVPKDRKRFAALPDILEVYRGCVLGQNEDGLSYTLDKQRAEWFAARFVEGEQIPAVVVARVEKHNVFAYINNRNEDEIVVLDEQMLYIDHYEELA
jgi:hypothetical protein